MEPLTTIKHFENILDSLFEELKENKYIKKYISNEILELLSYRLRNRYASRMTSVTKPRTSFRLKINDNETLDFTYTLEKENYKKSGLGPYISFRFFLKVKENKVITTERAIETIRGKHCLLRKTIKLK